VAIMVIVFGIHRIRLSFRSAAAEDAALQRKGLYAMGRRKHRFVGLLYVLLGAALIATTFGWNPMGNLFASETQPGETTKPSLPEDGLQR